MGVFQPPLEFLVAEVAGRAAESHRRSSSHRMAGTQLIVAGATGVAQSDESSVGHHFGYRFRAGGPSPEDDSTR
jgi:hypothetical protein